MKLVFIGAPGSGKGTLAKKIAEKHKVSHISTGDIIRDHISKKTPLGLEVKGILESGKLVSDQLVQKLVESTLHDDEVNARGYILDGFPRTLPQAEWFVKTFSVDQYVIFDISKETILNRITGRLIHPASGRIYHKTLSPPQVEGKDNETGENLIQREDDKKENVFTRLQVYEKQTYPIIQYIQEQTTNLVHIDAELLESQMLESVEKLQQIVP